VVFKLKLASVRLGIYNTLIRDAESGLQKAGLEQRRQQCWQNTYSDVLFKLLDCDVDTMYPFVVANQGLYRVESGVSLKATSFRNTISTYTIYASTWSNW
jgi:hypothetical protein